MQIFFIIPILLFSFLSSPIFGQNFRISSPKGVAADFSRGYNAARDGDYASAVRWYTFAADEGNAAAQYNLGVIYENGSGVAKQYKTAVRWYTLAADQGYAAAQYNLGVIYENGSGVAKQYKTAVRWYTLAADQGYVEAQYNLGVIYENGSGVAQEYDTALRWYTLASAQGHANAQNNLGAMYYKGAGVQKSNAYAHIWFNIAASSVDTANAQKNMDMVEKEMTTSEIKKAQSLARKCVAKKYTGC